MECPVCRAQNSPEAKCCTVCFEFFTGRAPPVQKLPLFPGVSTEVDGWTFEGPLVVAESGLYFLIAEAEFEAAWPARLAAFLLGQAAGPLGGLTAEAAVSAAAEGGPRPAGLTFGHRSEIAGLYDRSLSEDPTIIACREYFMVPRKEVLRVELAVGGIMEVFTEGKILHVNGASPVETMKGYLSLWGYPATVDLYNRRVLGKLALGAGLALCGLIAVILEFAEIQAMFMAVSHSERLKDWVWREDGTPSPVFGAAVMIVVIPIMAVFYGRARKYRK